MNNYVVGNTVIITTTFLTENNVAFDPPGVFLTINKAGKSSTYQYGVNSEIQFEVTGTYSSDLILDTVGGWNYYWFTSGTYSASNGQFLVEESGV